MNTALSIKLNEPSGWDRILSIEVPTERVEAERGKIIRHYQKTAKVPGFRPGKVPRNVVQNRFDELIKSRLLETVVPEAYKEAVEEKELTPITEAAIENLQITDDLRISFDAKFEIKPEIELARYTSFKLEKKTRSVDSEHIDEAILDLRKRHAQYLPVDRPSQINDLVVVDYVPLTDDGKPIEQEKKTGHTFTLGSGTVLKDFEDAILGLKKGEQTETSVRYPENYYVKEMAGTVRRYKISVSETKEQILPESNNEFAQSLGDFQTLQELKDKIRENLIAEADLEATKEVEHELMSQIIEANPFDVPQSMMESQLEHMVNNFKSKGIRPDATETDEEEEDKKFREILEPVAVREVKKILIIDKLAKMANMEITDEEIDAEIKQQAEAHNKSFERLKNDLKKSGEFDLLKHNLLLRKVYDFLLSKSNIKEVNKV